MRAAPVLGLLLVPWAIGAQPPDAPLSILPPGATSKLARSLTVARAHERHVWLDTAPINDDGTINAYIEIPRGDRRKWEFDMSANLREVDRIMPAEIGGYPVNYGFVPQTVSYDGDPFDALVLGPPLPGGRVVRGVAVGLMCMEDEKGSDAKVVLALQDRGGRPVQALTEADRTRIGGFFRRYKEHEPGGFSRVPGWGSNEEGLAHVKTTHAFFRECRERAGAACQVRASAGRGSAPNTKGR